MRKHSFSELVQQVHVGLGGISTLDDIIEVLERDYASEAFEASRRTLRNKVREALRSPDDDDLPRAYGVGNGKYMQRGLFSAAEYEIVVADFTKRANNNLRRRQKLIVECFERLGHTIEVES